MSLRLFFSKPSLVRQRGSQGLSGMSNLYLSTLRIIFNDEQLVAVDKPPGMLSVPGREKRKEVTSLTRSQEWSVVVSTLLAHLKRENSLSPLVAILHVLNEQRGRVPRQDQKFIRYAQRIMKNQCSKEDAQQLWLRLSSLDRSMYGTLPEEFPAELISASDIMEKQFNQRLFHLHRLDQETSGVLMFGKDSKSANYICNQFREHQIQKVYIALVHGNMLQTVPVTGKITFPLSPDVGNAPRQKIDEISGKSSETDYEVILLDDLRYHLYRPFFPELSEETTLVRLLPRTGRTHQLRVHLLGLGFPIIGDRLYCTPEQLGLVGESCRLCLHSLELHFKHPISEEEVHLKTINENEGQKS